MQKNFIKISRNFFMKNSKIQFPKKPQIGTRSLFNCFEKQTKNDKTTKGLKKMAKEIEESVKIFELFDFSFGNRREIFL